MTRRSLFVRLTALAAILVVLALAVGGAGLTWLFERELERRAAYDLGQHVRTLAAQVRIDAQGIALDAPPADPRFAEPYSGLYWQIDGTGGRRLRSRSLWDFSLPVAAGAAAAGPSIGTLPGPDGAVLLAVSRQIVVASPQGETGLDITVALDRRDLAAARGELLQLLVPSLLLLGVLLISAMAVFLHLALRPFRTLGAGLRAIHAGTIRTLAGRFPDEVQLVVDDLNRLIAFQDGAVREARARAGDLAHGLKTPLAVLGAVAREAAAQGNKRLSNDIDEQVRLMDQHVGRALAQARAGLVATLGHPPTPVKAIVAKTVNALSRLPRSRELEWQVSIDGDPQFRGEAGDLTEMLGNLLDNAGKWATRQVRVSVTTAADGLHVTVEDDGPGIPESDIGRIERGRRWDPNSAGSGFGLAITRDIVEAYRGRLVLTKSSFGGLAASLRFPNDR